MLSGVFNLIKPPGMTSHDVVAYLRRITATKKIGHAGTLDPDAAGVLPVFVGNATRLLEYTADSDKTYRAQMLLGVQTDTGDDSGKIIARQPVPDFSEFALNTALEKFIGEIEQIPPMYSALKQNGQKLYQLARRGVTVERAPRRISIRKIELLRKTKDNLLLEIDCSKGTYIRVLLEDIAAELGTCATMSFLLRTRAGFFSLKDANTLEEIASAPLDYVLPIDTALLHLPKLLLTANQAVRFCQGVKTTLPNSQQGKVRLYSDTGVFLGIGETDGQTLKSCKVLATREDL